jgi:Ankyrin repeats (3 copies)/Ankyrin repeats (many copies)
MPSSIRKALYELPTSLDDTYERALQEIPKEKRQHSHRLFQCLVAAIRPLHAEELVEIFAVDFDQGATCNFIEGWRPDNPEEAVLSTCSTLISVINDRGSRIVQFSHFSVKEFLTSDRLRISKVERICDYHIALDSAHTLLARACLAVLLQLDVDETRLDTLLLVSYAAQHWVEHAKYEDVAERVQGPMEELFNPQKHHFAAWISIHDAARGTVYSYFDSTPQLPPPGAAELFYAALCGLTGVAHYLIVICAQDINAHYCLLTPLHAASASGHAEVVHLLLRHNAEVNIRCTSGARWTPLLSASRFGHANVVQLLLEHGADVTAQNVHNCTSLWFASYGGHVEVVRLLLDHGADIHARGPFNKTLYQRAIESGRVEVAQFLLEQGAERD